VILVQEVERAGAIAGRQDAQGDGAAGGVVVQAVGGVGGRGGGAGLGGGPRQAAGLGMRAAAWQP